MKKITFPLKAKISLLFGTLLVGALTFYVAYAIKLFNEDKSAYIFDSTFATVEQMGEQVNGHMAYLASLVAPFFVQTKFLQDEANIRSLRNFLGNKAEIYQIYFLEGPAKTPGPKLFIHAPPDTDQDALERFFEFEDDNIQKSETAYASKTLDFGDNKIFQSVLTVPNGTVILRSAAHELFRVATKGSLHYFLLFDRHGKTTLDGGRREYIEGLKLKPDEMARQILSFQKSQQKGRGDSNTTSVVELNLSGKEGKSLQILLGLKYISSLDSWIGALIPKHEAFRAARLLIERSLLLGGLLLSLGIFFGILFARGLTRPVEKLTSMAVKVAAGEFGATVDIKGRDEMASLAQTFNYMSKEIEHYIGEMKEKTRIEQELYVAQLVQSTFFPEQDWKRGPIEISGRFLSASECGGDWWGLFRHGNKVLIFICDATGHGVGAALMTAMAFCTIRNLKEVLVDRPDFLENPGKILAFMNHAATGPKGKMHMTAAVGVLDLETYHFKYSNASHCPPLLYKACVDHTGPGKDQFIPLMEVNGTRLGHRSGEIYRHEEILLEKGDSIFFFSDGITETENKENKTYGQRRLLKSLQNTGMSSARNIVEGVFADVGEFRGAGPVKDDCTVVCLKRQFTNSIHLVLAGGVSSEFDKELLMKELGTRGMEATVGDDLALADFIIFWVSFPLTAQDSDFLKTHGKKCYVISHESGDVNIEQIMSPFEVRHLTGHNAPDFYGEMAINLVKEMAGPLWGIEQYLGPDVVIQKNEINSSGEILHTVQSMIEQFDLTPYFGAFKDFLATVSVELVSNAVFDAATKPSGGLKYYEGNRQNSVDLDNKEKVIMKMGHNKKFMALSVQDNFGRLKRDIILEGILRCVRERTPKVGSGGAGLGLYMAFSLSSTLIVNLWDEKRTEVIALFDLQKRQKSYKERVASFHFFREE